MLKYKKNHIIDFLSKIIYNKISKSLVPVFFIIKDYAKFGGYYFLGGLA